MSGFVKDGRARAIHTGRGGCRMSMLINALRDLTSDVDEVVKRHNRDKHCECKLCANTRELWAKRARFATKQARRLR